jgi:integrase/recombinase XerC
MTAAPAVIGTERPEVEDFLKYIDAIKEYSPHTLTAYRHDLKVLADWLDEQYPAGWEFETPTRADIRRFLGDLERKGRSRETRARQLAVIHSFVQFVGFHLDRDLPKLALQTRCGRLAKRLTKHLSEEQVGELFRLAEQDVTVNGTWGHRQAIRDLAMYETLYSTGMRLAELCALDRDDVTLGDKKDPIRGWADVKRAKGGKAGGAPLGTYAVRAIKAWLPIRAKLQDHHQMHIRALFLSMPGYRIGHRAVQRRVEKMLIRIGAPDLSVHSFRHSFATHLLDQGASLRAIQEMLNHVSLDQTGRYCAVAVKNLKKTYMASHPRANYDGYEGLYEPHCRPDEPEGEA